MFTQVQWIELIGGTNWQAISLRAVRPQRKLLNLDAASSLVVGVVHILGTIICRKDKEMKTV